MTSFVVQLAFCLGSLCVIIYHPSMASASDDSQITVKKQLVISSSSHAWSVPATMIKEVDNVTFVKLQPSRNFGFVQLVCGSKISKNSSLSKSVGYRALMQLRSGASDKPTAAADLFEATAPSTGKKKKLRRTSTDDDVNSEIVNLDVSGVAVKALPANHPQEAVWVEANDSSMAAVIAFIRSNGLDEAEGADDDKEQLQPGMIRMGAGRVAFRNEDGSLKYVKK